MLDRRRRSAPNDQRGIALPLALIVLALLTSLTLAFLAMSSKEPTIAANLQRGEGAFALAEAGIERARWALSNPTVDTAGANTKLNNLNAIPAAYSGGTLFTLTAPGGAVPSGAYTINISGAGPTTITSRGFVIRNGVAPPALLANLATSDIAAQRSVTLQVTASGPLGGAADPNNVTLPGALAVAGSIQTNNTLIVDGERKAAGVMNNCTNKAGSTITVGNTIQSDGSANFQGNPGNQKVSATEFAKYVFTQSQLDGLKALAQAQGTYIMPTSNAQFTFGANGVPALGNGLTFVDTVNGAALGSPPNAANLASARITSIPSGTASGWLIVVGSLRVDGNITYNGLVYAHNDLSYNGTGTGGIYGAVVSANVVDPNSAVDTDLSGTTNFYYDCQKVANGGGAFSTSTTDALSRSTVTVTPGSWREVSN